MDSDSRVRGYARSERRSECPQSAFVQGPLLFALAKRERTQGLRLHPRLLEGAQSRSGYGFGLRQDRRSAGCANSRGVRLLPRRGTEPGTAQPPQGHHARRGGAPGIQGGHRGADGVPGRAPEVAGGGARRSAHGVADGLRGRVPGPLRQVEGGLPRHPDSLAKYQRIDAGFLAGGLRSFCCAHGCG